MKERKYIVKFIQCIAEQNYAQGNKYLKAVITEKLKNRIAAAVRTTTLF
jgi:SLT domain-containing protein